MRLVGKKKLEKLLRKNKGNNQLQKAVEQLVNDIERNNWKKPEDVELTRNDVDCVHSDGFYFFDLSVHRSMIMLEFSESEATVVWVGDHQEYERVFHNNRNTIKKWLRSNNWI